jgi:hypothetical protein
MVPEVTSPGDVQKEVRFQPLTELRTTASSETSTSNKRFARRRAPRACAMAWILLLIVLALTLLVMRGTRRFVNYEALK